MASNLDLDFSCAPSLPFLLHPQQPLHIAQPSLPSSTSLPQTSIQTALATKSPPVTKNDRAPLSSRPNRRTSLCNGGSQGTHMTSAVQRPLHELTLHQYAPVERQRYCTQCSLEMSGQGINIVNFKRNCLPSTLSTCSKVSELTWTTADGGESCTGCDETRGGNCRDVRTRPPPARRPTDQARRTTRNC